MPIIIRKKKPTAAPAEPAPQALMPVTMVSEPLPTETSPAPVPCTLANVIEQVRKNLALSPAQKSDLISACVTAARIASSTPSDLRADAPTLRRIFKEATPGTAGLSIKRFENVRAGVARACKLVDAIPTVSNADDLSALWDWFLHKSPRKHIRYNLARFAAHCSVRGREPAQVNNESLADFADYLDQRMVSGEPRKVIKSTRLGFNATAKAAGMTVVLPPRDRQGYISAPLSLYPAPLQQEVNAYLASLKATDLFADLDAGRDLRPVSIRNTRRHLLQLLDAAVTSGIPRHTLTQLQQTVQKATWAPAFEVIRARIGEPYPATLTVIARSLLVLAREHLEADAGTLELLQLAKKKISQANGLDRATMGRRSRLIMEQFDDEENVFKLLRLPQKLISLAPTRRREYDGALDAAVAAAIALLLNVPLRMKNLAEARLGHEVIRKGTKTSAFFDVRFLASKTKNDNAIEAVVSKTSAAIMDRYIQKFRHCLIDGSSEMLFPAADCGARDAGKFGVAISDRILKHTGLRMTPHCFRHFAAKLILDEDAGAIRKVQQVLNHKKLETTNAFYCDPNAKASFEDYHEILEKKIGAKK